MDKMTHHCICFFHAASVPAATSGSQFSFSPAARKTVKEGRAIEVTKKECDKLTELHEEGTFMTESVLCGGSRMKTE